MPYGPGDAGIDLVETYGSLELEYSAIRKSSILLDQPHRATVEVSGSDAADFLNNMLTRNVAGLDVGRATRSFWLNRKGRIDADLRVVRLADRFVFDVDVFAAGRLVETLGAYVITEDVEIRETTAELHRLAVHGPAGAAVLAELTGSAAPLEEDRVAEATIAGHSVLIDRHDSAGVPGFELTVSTPGASAMWEAFAAMAPRSVGGEDEGFAAAPGGATVRPAGFHAWNIARIEAGTPVFNLDFGHDSLPGETGVLRDRVDFDKGCYLGQEVVARMDALGHPKRLLVGVQFESVPADPEHPEVGPLQPVTGSVLRDAEGGEKGGVSSSTLSPLLGRAPIALATVKWGSHEPGTELFAEASGMSVRGVVREVLRFVEV